MPEPKKPSKLMQPWLTEEGLIRIEGWCKDGLTDEQIAEKMGITAKTIYDWKKKSDKFKNAFKEGKDSADRKVEKSLYKSALGYTITLKKPIKLKTTKKKDGMLLEEEEVKYVDEEVHIPPNVTAQIFWLKNRKPAAWRDKQIVETKDEGQLAKLIDGLKNPPKRKVKKDE